MPNKIKLIVIEEDEDDYYFLSKNIEKWKDCFEYFWIKDGQEASNFFEGISSSKEFTENKYLVFVDINLPKLNGLELVKAFREKGNFKKLRIIMLTGSKDENDRETARENGADLYLVKPLTREEVVKFKKIVEQEIFSLLNN